MPNKTRSKWKSPFVWPPNKWEFTPGMQFASDGVTAFVFLLIILTVFAGLISWPLLLWRTVNAIAIGTEEAIRNTLLAVGALLGVPFLIWRTLIASKQTDINRQSHYTALFTKAVEQLGADKIVKHRDFRQTFEIDSSTKQVIRGKDGLPIPALGPNGQPLGEYENYEVTEVNYEVRLGAIYALERIAQDSKRDSWPIYLTLGAYIQNNAPDAVKDVKSGDPKENNSDIEEIFNVLCRFQYPETINSMLYFDGIHIPQIAFIEGSLRSIIFSECSSTNITLRCEIDSVHFQKCLMSELHLYEIEFNNSEVTDCDMGKLHINHSTINNCDFGSPKTSQLVIVISKFDQSQINLHSSNVHFFSNRFEDTSFHSREKFGFGGESTHIKENEFVNCEFLSCDFSFDDLSSNSFQNCSFRECNLIETKGLPSDADLSECFTPDKVTFNDETPISLSDIRTQWINWKYRATNPA